jgi:hypothetical protein
MMGEDVAGDRDAAGVVDEDALAVVVEDVVADRDVGLRRALGLQADRGLYGEVRIGAVVLDEGVLVDDCAGQQAARDAAVGVNRAAGMLAGLVVGAK